MSGRPSIPREAGTPVSTAARPAPDAVRAMRILTLLRDDDLDAAIDAGLAAFVPLTELDGPDNRILVEARDRLLAAWAARERYRARARRLARLERRAAERRRAQALPAEARAAAVAPPTGHGERAEDTGAAPRGEAGTAPPARPALPAAAAAALARARARASGRQP